MEKDKAKNAEADKDFKILAINIGDTMEDFEDK